MFAAQCSLRAARDGSRDALPSKDCRTDFAFVVDSSKCGLIDGGARRRESSCNSQFTRGRKSVLRPPGPWLELAPAVSRTCSQSA
jgi:hypothetical protein